MTLVVTVVAATTVSCQSSPVDGESDVVALRALDQAYASEWIAGDADGVMSLFTADATLVPHHGDTPVVGRAAIRDFWFNPVYPPTVVPAWTRNTEEIVVSGDVAIVRGRSVLTWEYDGIRTTIPEGNYVLVAVKRAEEWRIRLLTWNDDPREWLQEPIKQD
ncbi:MAG: nuclear transport factor 2 family protein [Acidobacteriota bacterium]|nr:nuclear transport factor 2 family protein [Acidobacteriota bacterium]MDH3784545.1 nuclear transport factor 2 family protein [Acidobacteriota bacterium]